VPRFISAEPALAPLNSSRRNQLRSSSGRAALDGDEPGQRGQRDRGTGQRRDRAEAGPAALDQGEDECRQGSRAERLAGQVGARGACDRPFRQQR
jgi:hypothetical protein